MQNGNRFRCYPTPAQEQILLQWIGCQRYIYNAKVREDQCFRRFARKSLQHAGQFAPIDQQYAQFKTELTPWLSDDPATDVVARWWNPKGQAERTAWFDLSESRGEKGGAYRTWHTMRDYMDADLPVPDSILDARAKDRSRGRGRSRDDGMSR